MLLGRLAKLCLSSFLGDVVAFSVSSSLVLSYRLRDSVIYYICYLSAKLWSAISEVSLVTAVKLSGHLSLFLFWLRFYLIVLKVNLNLPFGWKNYHSVQWVNLFIFVTTLPNFFTDLFKQLNAKISSGAVWSSSDFICSRVPFCDYHGM